MLNFIKNIFRKRNKNAQAQKAVEEEENDPLAGRIDAHLLFLLGNIQLVIVAFVRGTAAELVGVHHIEHFADDLVRDEEARRREMPAPGGIFFGIAGFGAAPHKGLQNRKEPEETMLVIMLRDAFGGPPTEHQILGVAV